MKAAPAPKQLAAPTNTPPKLEPPAIVVESVELTVEGPASGAVSPGPTIQRILAPGCAVRPAAIIAGERSTASTR